MNWKVSGIVVAFAAGLVFSGMLRLYHLRVEDAPAWTANATLVYIGLTVLAVILLRRTGVTLNGLGFGAPLNATRYLARFSDVQGSPAETIKLLALSWTVAAFGEELAFRIVLMSGIAIGLNNTIGILGVYSSA